MEKDERCKELREEVMKNKGKVRTQWRFCPIISEYVGKSIEVYNGNRYINVYVTKQHVGFKLGDFSQTKKEVIHSFKGKMTSKR